VPDRSIVVSKDGGPGDRVPARSGDGLFAARQVHVRFVRFRAAGRHEGRARIADPRDPDRKDAAFRNGQWRGVRLQCGEEHRRAAGIGGRRHPGVDAGDRNFAGRDADGTDQRRDEIAPRGDEADHQQQEYGRAHDPGITPIAIRSS
jgi:hypothetical protein